MADGGQILGGWSPYLDLSRGRMGPSARRALAPGGRSRGHEGGSSLLGCGHARLGFPWTEERPRSSFVELALHRVARDGCNRRQGALRCVRREAGPLAPRRVVGPHARTRLRSLCGCATRRKSPRIAVGTSRPRRPSMRCSGHGRFLGVLLRGISLILNLALRLPRRTPLAMPIVVLGHERIGVLTRVVAERAMIANRTQNPACSCHASGPFLVRSPVGEL